jgi:hypothetical protein
VKKKKKKQKQQPGDIYVTPTNSNRRRNGIPQQCWGLQKKKQQRTV